MDKERLEEMREKYSKAEIIEHLYGVEIIAADKKDIDYLIGQSIAQAERVEELEKILDKVDGHLVRNGKQIMKLTDEKAELEYQNKRYREVLENIRNKAKEDYFKTDIYIISDEALEESE